MDTLLDKAKNWAFENLVDFIKSEGELVSKEVAEKRIEICNSCPYKGIVEPIPTIKIDGCTICGCPFKTKAFMKTMLRGKGKDGTPLTASEVIELKTKGKFSRKDFVIEKIKCPHPQGNKWAIIK